jgi:hypothetical protein
VFVEHHGGAQGDDARGPTRADIRVGPPAGLAVENWVVDIMRFEDDRVVVSGSVPTTSACSSNSEFSTTRGRPRRGITTTLVRAAPGRLFRQKVGEERVGLFLVFEVHLNFG